MLSLIISLLAFAVSVAALVVALRERKHRRQQVAPESAPMEPGAANRPIWRPE